MPLNCMRFLMLLVFRATAAAVDYAPALLQVRSVSLPRKNAQRALKALDSNNDGHISADEISAWAAANDIDADRATAELSAFDNDGDGVLSTAELSGAFGGPPPLVSQAALGTPAKNYTAAAVRGAAALEANWSGRVPGPIAGNETAAAEHGAATLEANGTGAAPGLLAGNETAAAEYGAAAFEPSATGAAPSPLAGNDTAAAEQAAASLGASAVVPASSSLARNETAAAEHGAAALSAAGAAPSPLAGNETSAAEGEVVALEASEAVSAPGTEPVAEDVVIRDEPQSVASDDPATSSAAAMAPTASIMPSGPVNELDLTHSGSNNGAVGAVAASSAIEGLAATNAAMAAPTSTLPPLGPVDRLEPTDSSVNMMHLGVAPASSATEEMAKPNIGAIAPTAPIPAVMREEATAAAVEVEAARGAAAASGAAETHGSSRIVARGQDIARHGLAPVRVAELPRKSEGYADNAATLHAASQGLVASSTFPARLPLPEASTVASGTTQQTADKVMSEYARLERLADQADVQAAAFRAKARALLENSTLETLETGASLLAQT